MVDLYAMLKDSGLLNGAMICALALIVWFLKKGLTTFETNLQEHSKCITDLYNKHNDLSVSFSLLLGNHDAQAK